MGTIKKYEEQNKNMISQYCNFTKVHETGSKRTYFNSECDPNVDLSKNIVDVNYLCPLCKKIIDVAHYVSV